MTCPKCNTEPLAAFIIEGVTVDRCPTCAGVWFDARELSQLLSEEAQHVARILKGSVTAPALTYCHLFAAYCRRRVKLHQGLGAAVIGLWAGRRILALKAKKSRVPS